MTKSSQLEHKLLTTFRRLPPQFQQSVLSFVENLAKKQGALK
ncbi:MAG: hypothetical protein RJS97_05060 [Parvibaculaceae bacterium]